MDALLVLTADHNRVRGLFTRFKRAHEGDDTAQMSELVAKILTELDIHSRIEEDLFYPEVSKANDELREAVAEGLQEHHVVHVLAAEIKALPPGDEAWEAKVTVLIENVEHHAEEEETEMFPEVRAAFGTDSLEALGERLEMMKTRLGAPTAADKEALTTEQLKELATEQEIPGRSTMRREELVATVAPS